MPASSISVLAAQLAAKQVSSRELAQQYLDRIAALNPSINAFITVDADKTLSEAAAADALIATGKAGPLTKLVIPPVLKRLAMTWHDHSPHGRLKLTLIGYSIAIKVKP